MSTCPMFHAMRWRGPGYGFTLLENVLDSDTAAAMRQALIRCQQEHGTEHTHRGSARHVAGISFGDVAGSESAVVADATA